MLISPKNWTEFQHYKNRRPPWIKLYRTLLDDVEFHCLPDASKALAIMLWLLASEHESGSINADPKALAFRLRTTPDKMRTALKPLIDGGFFVASTALAGCKQDAIPETERETETKRETEPRFALPDWVPIDAWTGFCEMRRKSKSAFTERAKALLVAELFKLVEAGGNAAAILDQSTANGWKGVFPLKVNGGNGKTQGALWWSSNEGIQAKAAELHIESRKGESWSDLKARVSAALEQTA